MPFPVCLIDIFLNKKFRLKCETITKVNLHTKSIVTRKNVSLFITKQICINLTLVPLQVPEKRASNGDT